MRMKIKAAHIITTPYATGVVPALSTPLIVVVYGRFPVAATIPKMHRRIPGHPQRSAVAMVAIIPVLRLFMISFSS
jgi:hypothetical protein